MFAILGYNKVTIGEMFINNKRRIITAAENITESRAALIYTTVEHALIKSINIFTNFAFRQLSTGKF